MAIFDGFVKSKNLLFYVIPAEVRRGGSFQSVSAAADFHGSDDFEIYYEAVIITQILKKF
jgi:hypothetical protein